MFGKVKTSLDIIWISHFMSQVVEQTNIDAPADHPYWYFGSDVKNHMNISASVLSELVALVASESSYTRLQFESEEWQSWLW